MPETVNKQDLYGLLRKHGWRPDRVEGGKQLFANDDGRRYRSEPLPREIPSEVAKHLLEGMRIVQSNGSSKAPAEVIAAARATAPKGRKGGKRGYGQGGAQPGTFGHRLFEARVAAGLSQAQLSREVGAHQVLLSEWERGASSPIMPDGRIKFKRSAPIVARIAEKFAWDDILAVTGKAPLANGATKTATFPAEIPEPVVTLTDDEKPTELGMALDELRRRHPDERDFAKLLKATDIMQWVINVESENRQLRAAIAKYERADIGGLRREAQAYRELKGDMAKLLKRMEELEA